MNDINITKTYYYEKYMKYKNKYTNSKNKIKSNLTNSNERKPNKIIEIDTGNLKNTKWRENLPLVKKNMILVDNNNNSINLLGYENFEQYLISKWLKPNDIVLELGGRFGVVSCTINLLLDNEYKSQHVVVEPDILVTNTLKHNKKISDSKFIIETSVINNNEVFFYSSNKSSGLGNFVGIYIEENDAEKNNTTQKFQKQKICNITHKDFFNKYKQKFNVMIVDCEGCLCDFFKQNKKILETIEMIIFEKDNEEICNYDYIYKKLKNNNFKLVDKLGKKIYNNFYKGDNSYTIDGFQQVWIKK